MTDASNNERTLDALLSDYPSPKAAPGHFEQALRQAAERGRSLERRRRWLGGAVAACLVAFLAFGLLSGSPSPTANDIPGVQITVAMPQTVNLLFAAETALDDAELNLTLPEGVELDGFPGQREIRWHTSLTAGDNVLPLRLIGTVPASGQLVARLSHNGKSRAFTLQIEVS